PRRLSPRRAATELQRERGYPRQDRLGRDHRAAHRRGATPRHQRPLPPPLRVAQHDDGRHLARLPVHLLVLQREERHGAHDAGAGSPGGRALDPRRGPAPRHRLALHRGRRLLPQPVLGADPRGHGRIPPPGERALLHDAGRRRGGYMSGSHCDGPGSGRQSAEWLLEVGVDLASFFIVTPLPGTEDHDKAVREGTIADWDFNQYDSQHMVSHHPRMTPAEVERAYREAYLTFYSARNTLRSLFTWHRVPGLGWPARTAMMP